MKTTDLVAVVTGGESAWAAACMAVLGNVNMRYVDHLVQLQGVQWRAVALVGNWYLRPDVEQLMELCRAQRAGGATVVTVQPAHLGDVA